MKKNIIFLALLFSANTLLAQFDCYPPTLISPLSWQSVDPPVFEWIPPPNPPFHCYNQLECDYDYTCPIFYTSGVLFYTGASYGYHVVTNSEWNNYPVNLGQCYCLKHGGSYSNGTYCVFGAVLIRLPAALPPTTPIIPANSATNVSLTPLLRWTVVADNMPASNYKVTIYTNPRLNNAVFDSLTVYDSIRVPIGRLSSNTTYWWRVKPYGNGGEGPYCDPWSFTTVNAPQPPPPPVLVRPLNNSTGLPLIDTLVWNASTGAVTYRLQVAIDAGFGTLILNDSSITTTSRIIYGLSPLTTYYWRVNAKNPGGTSSWSPVWNFKTRGTPAQVTLYAPPNNSTNIPTTYTFRWSKAYDQTTHLLVSNYWFEKVTDTTTMANLLRDTTLSDTLRVVTGMGNNTSYYWRVKARNEIGWGNFASWYKFTTIPSIPTAPVLISPPNNATGQPLTPMLDWSAVTGATSYRVQVTIDSTFTVISALDSSNVNWDSLRIPAGRLNNNIKYFWRVNASNSGGSSQWSASWKFTTAFLSITQLGALIPTEYKLYYNYPNPFNPFTKIRFDIPGPDFVTVKIFDILGREVETLAEEQVNPGTYEVNFDGTNYPSGVYFYKIITDKFSETKKMLLIK